MEGFIPGLTPRKTSSLSSLDGSKLVTPNIFPLINDVLHSIM
jgi:hypothetical protein